MNDLRCGAASLLRGERHPDAKSGWLKGGTGIPLPVARHFSPVPFRVIKNDSGLTLNLSYCLCPKTLSSLEVIPFFLGEGGSARAAAVSHAAVSVCS